MPLSDSDVVITVSSHHVIICRHRLLADGSLMYECARNADDLEADAMLALAKSSKPFMTGQEYPCPRDLAKQAHWN